VSHPVHEYHERGEDADYCKGDIEEGFPVATQAYTMPKALIVRHPQL
jgi:hypothetical protein